MKAERIGYGKRVDWGDLEADNLSSAIKEVLTVASYREVVSQLSDRMRDRLVHPLEEAAYHVEYVMRHKGADFLRSPSKDLNWFQYTLLDVTAFIFLVIFALLLIVVKTCKCICGFRKSSSAIDNQKKRN